MRIRRKKGTKEKIVLHDDLLVLEPEQMLGKWHEFFGNDYPIYLEVGTGFGQFIRGQAKKNPKINYIALEKIEEVLIKTIMTTKEEGITNLRFLWFNANQLELIFAENELDKIYLNFSDPWPKNKTAKRRLTHSNFLNKYQEILKPRAKVEFKTDNQLLFEFSLNEFSKEGWKMENICLDVGNRGPEDNIQTEYETKFSGLGMPIYRLEAINPK
jgi:tRNA (guanine-N7-)-methyltransferase